MSELMLPRTAVNRSGAFASPEKCQGCSQSPTRQPTGSPFFPRRSPSPKSPSRFRRRDNLPGDEEKREEVKVVVRVRPPMDESNPASYFVDKGDPTKLLGYAAAESSSPSASFGKSSTTVEELSFSRVVAPQENTSQMFESLGLRNLIEGVAQGYQETVFAYGQTGSGKTHTILGSARGELGLLQLCTWELFRIIFAGNGVGQRQASDVRRRIQLVCLEIKNDDVLDLLPSDMAQCQDAPEEEVEVLYVKGRRHNFRRVLVWSYEEAMVLLRHAIASREVGSSHLNSESSRSHMIVRFMVKTFKAEDASHAGSAVAGSLTLVDLAGNERDGNCPNGTAINVSLTHLNRMLVKMQEGQLDESDRRQSALNMALFEQLKEDCGVTMIFCIHPERRHAAAARSTLQMATLCRRIVQQKRVRRIESSNLSQKLAGLRCEASALMLAHQEARATQLAKEEEQRKTTELLESLKLRYEEKSKDYEELRNSLEREFRRLSEEGREQAELVSNLEQRNEELARRVQQLQLGASGHLEPPSLLDSALETLGDLSAAGEGLEDHCQEIERAYRHELQAVHDAYGRQLRNLREAMRQRPETPMKVERRAEETSSSAQVARDPFVSTLLPTRPTRTGSSVQGSSADEAAPQTRSRLGFEPAPSSFGEPCSEPSMHSCSVSAVEEDCQVEASELHAATASHAAGEPQPQLQSSFHAPTPEPTERPAEREYPQHPHTNPEKERNVSPLRASPQRILKVASPQRLPKVLSPQRQGLSMMASASSTSTGSRSVATTAAPSDDGQRSHAPIVGRLAVDIKEDEFSNRTARRSWLMSDISPTKSGHPAPAPQSLQKVSTPQDVQCCSAWAAPRRASLATPPMPQSAVVRQSAAGGMCSDSVTLPCEAKAKGPVSPGACHVTAASAQIGGGTDAASAAEMLSSQAGRTQKALGRVLAGQPGTIAEVEAIEEAVATLARFALQARLEPQIWPQCSAAGVRVMHLLPRSPQAQRDGAILLSELANKDPAMKEDIASQGALALAVTALRWLAAMTARRQAAAAGQASPRQLQLSQQQLQEACSANFRLLAMLCQRHAARQATVAELGGLQLCLQCLSQPELGQGLDAAIHGCWLLMAMCYKHSGNQDLVRAAGGVALVMRLLENQVSALEATQVQAAGGTLDSCSYHQRAALVEPQAATLCAYAAGFLASMAEGSDASRQVLHDGGGISILLRALKSCLQSPHVVANTCVAVAHLAYMHECSQRAARAQGGVMSILGALLAYRGNGPVQGSICRAIAVLSEGPCSMTQQAFLAARLADGGKETGAVALLVQALRDLPQDASLVTTACWALANLVKDSPEALDYFCTIRGTETVVALLRSQVTTQDRPCEYLCRLLCRLTSGTSVSARRSCRDLITLGAPEVLRRAEQQHLAGNSASDVIAALRTALDAMQVEEGGQM